MAGRVLFEAVEARRGNRRWPNDLKARIVAESPQPGVRVADVAPRHYLVARQLSCWRRQGLLAMPAELMPAEPCENSGPFEPVFVTLVITTEPPLPQTTDASPVL
jgi:transposase